jgi:NADPH:quinone reductase-like Zn-dependent oxidoreductase/acyl carrier protein
VHVRGVGVDWAAVLGRGQVVDLPTYPFQRQRYWVAQTGQDGPAGPGAAGHPLLGTGTELAAGRGYLFAGRLSVTAQPWLADHAVAGTILLPGTAFVELALRAGGQCGCERLEELALEAPLVLPADAAIRVQAMLGVPDEAGQRTVEIYARPVGVDADDGAWTRHASGRLAPAPGPAASTIRELVDWPPPGAEPVGTAGFYEALAAGGYSYGPAFRGLRAAWRRGTDVFAEVVLPDDAAAGAGSFGLHPALLDAAWHPAGLAEAAGAGEIRLPFAYTGVSLHGAGASALRVWLRPDAGQGLSLAAADASGLPVVSVDSLVLRPVSAEQLAAARDGVSDALFALDWTLVPAADDVAAGEGGLAVVGADLLGLAAGLAAASVPVRAYRDLAELISGASAAHGPEASSEPMPNLVLACAGSPTRPEAAGDPAATARLAAAQALDLVQRWLAEEPLASSRLVLVTQGAVAAAPGEDVADLAGAAVWGLVRSAQSENPDRLVLADLPVGAGADALGPLAAALGSAEPELVVRDQAAYGRRLARPSGGLVVPRGGPWRLDSANRGTLQTLELLACPEAAAPLGPGQVRVAVRAAGMNFRDVLMGLAMYPGEAVMGGEVAGVVTGTGPGVTRLAEGDRVFGMAGGGFGPIAVTDARLLAPIPGGWSFARAAAVPAAYLTAWHALTELVEARQGQRILVHAATGGVGMAAVAVARRLGLEVFGTASPGKHHVLAGMGLDASHIASSRTAEFAEKFPPMDIVLNSLAGELTDASLRLVAPGGVFIEMGKTDARDPALVARAHPGVSYRPFDLSKIGTERMGGMLAQIAGLLAAEELPSLPVRAWDVRRAPDAFRFMSQARHTGKLVLTVPPDPAAPREAGTVLITGGTGTLGALTARHLAGTGRARALLLTSRSGPAAPGAAALAADLAAHGGPVHVVACDAADRDALAALLAAVPAGCPLTGVVHTAGILDDGVTGALTAARLDAVMAPKADAAWHLHELTEHSDLDAFVLFSSAAATFGGAGQGNYAAGNAFLDALASYRQSRGLPATSLAWGLWADASTLTGRLGGTDRARMTRGGMVALSAADGLALLDAALARDEALLVPARLDLAGLRTQAARGAAVPPLWRGLIRQATPDRSLAAQGADTAETLRRRLAEMPAPDQDRMLLNLVRAHVAAVLGHASPAAVQPGRAFTDLGFDSLTAVELRNRLSSATGLRLPATMTFDYPTAAALAGHLKEELSPTTSAAAEPDEDELRQALATIPLSRLRHAGLLDALLRLADSAGDAGGRKDSAGDIDTLDAESLVRMAFDSERAD